MQYIQHRVNKINDLKSLHSALGAEIDIRSDVHQPSSLHLSHDPWSPGDKLSEWLETYKAQNQKGTIIFNTKEDNLEEEILSLCNKYQISNFFFLDTALPTLIRFLQTEHAAKFACRLSKYESLDFLEPFENQVKWLWADCFQGEPLAASLLERASKKFQICLVSPELQKQSLDKINGFKHLVPFLHSICSKRPDLWT